MNPAGPQPGGVRFYLPDVVSERDAVILTGRGGLQSGDPAFSAEHRYAGLLVASLPHSGHRTQ